MNKFEAVISLCIITFFASIQYAFLGGVPSSVSQFGYLTLTNGTGFIIVLLFFFGELFRLDKKQILQAFILSLEQVAFNVFLILGAGKTGATVTSCVLSAYFVFIPPLALLLFHEKPDFKTFPGIAIVLMGLFFMMNCEASSLLSEGVLYLLLADVVIALTILTISRFSANSNPSIIAMGQLFFSFIISAACWIFEVLFFGKSFTLSVEPSFWICVLYVSLFIRGLYSIVQLYAMRYVSPLSTSLIFSTEIIMTMLMSPVLAFLFGTEKEIITPMRALGASVMVVGVLLADSSVYTAIIQGIKKLKEPPVEKRSAAEKLYAFWSDLKKWWSIILSIAIVYACLDYMVQKMDFLDYESIVGLKNFLPIAAGLLWGVWGASGTCLGCIITALVLKTPGDLILCECLCNLLTGVGLWLIWHNTVPTHYVGFNKKRHFLVFIFSLVIISFTGACLSSLISPQINVIPVFVSYTSMGLFVALPLIILFGSLLHVQTAIPSKFQLMPDLLCKITSDSQTLAACNEQLEEAAMAKSIGIKRIFEVQSCIEEICIRIHDALPEAEINISIVFGSAISLRIMYKGNPYNPFHMKATDDAFSMTGLKILRHRALRASVFTSKKQQLTRIHIVI
ncbi:MAG: DMT family transporter [Treponema sp.]|nr:DMT family transporter [Treponema sp.]